ncbi:phosphatase modulator [Lithospermum erythrorhizon]|uniref:Phosphatase modulator n=1 Tax=Lithospermum erythrorhizon TaxID=34254 RepID=A0AAV3P3I1_LITER
MFWRMSSFSASSPVETILEKENFTLEELLDEDETIQECKALNGGLINFLRERAQVEQLIRYLVEEVPEDSDKTRSVKFPFIACEIFTCEVDVILKALVEDEELMNLLFSFVEPTRPHSTLLAGYFSKVVVCLLLRKTVPLMNYIRAHRDVIKKMADLIGITSIMEVLIRLIGADEHLYTNYSDSMQWLEDSNVLEMIVAKFSSSDCPEVHANAAEILCAMTRYAPPGLASKISSPSFIGRLFNRALQDSRPKSVLVNSLSFCISLLDPKRLTSGSYYIYNRPMTNSGIDADPEVVNGMLESLGDLLNLLEFSSEDLILLTTYGKLQPPLGKHRLKIVEFISVLVTVSSETAERELIRLGAVSRILELFFEYPFNNFLHHHVERIIQSCLENKNNLFVEHLLQDCDLVGRILKAEQNFTLGTDAKKPTASIGGKLPPRIGNIGHLTRIANKLVQLGNNNSDIQAYLQANNEWVDWQTNVLLQRNALENVFNWACGRPTAFQDRMRDSDDDDYQDRDYDVAALANNLSQAFRYGIYNNDEMDEAQGSLERDDEVYFDNESTEAVISSLKLEADQESASLFTNSDWFALEDKRMVNEPSTGSDASKSPLSADTNETKRGDVENVGVHEDDLAGTVASELPEHTPTIEVPEPNNLAEVEGEVPAKDSPESVEIECGENSEVDPTDPTIVPATSSDGQDDEITQNKADESSEVEPADPTIVPVTSSDGPADEVTQVKADESSEVEPADPAIVPTASSDGPADEATQNKAVNGPSSAGDSEVDDDKSAGEPSVST